MNEMLALITLDLKLGRVADLSLEQKHFRFRCKRCAALCCKLGGPALTRKDVERIADEGFSVKDFLEPISNPLLEGNMRSKEDGSCVFLESNMKLNSYRCNIYNKRPNLCRLYPLSFEIVDSDRVVLKLIPCCRGLNNREGEPVNESFIMTHLLEPLLEAMELRKKGARLF